MTGEAQANLQSYGANIVVAPKSKDVSLTYGGIDVGGVSVGSQGLSDADLERVRAIPARGTSPSSRRSWSARCRSRATAPCCMGVDPAAQFKLKRWWSVDAGRPPRNGHEFVAGAKAAQRPRPADGRLRAHQRQALHADRRPAAHGGPGRRPAHRRPGGRPGAARPARRAHAHRGRRRLLGRLRGPDRAPAHAALPDAEVTTVREAVQSRDARRGRVQGLQPTPSSAWSSASRSSWCSSP